MSLGIDGARINIPTVRGVLMGLVQLNTQKFGKYLNFHISHYCVRSLYHRSFHAKLPQQLDQLLLITLSKPVITRQCGHTI